MKETHIDLDLELPDDLSLTEAHKRSEDLEDALRRELPDLLRVAAHLEPRNDGSRRAARLSAAEEVRETSRNCRNCVRLHDVLEMDEGLVLTLKENFSGETSLREAHGAMADLERSLKLILRKVVRVHVDREISK